MKHLFVYQLGMWNFLHWYFFHSHVQLFKHRIYVIGTFLKSYLTLWDHWAMLHEFQSFKILILCCIFTCFFFFRTKMPIPKKSKEDANKEAYSSIDASQEAKSFLEKIMGDVSKSSATKQIIIGTTSGWYAFCVLIVIIVYFSNIWAFNTY